MKLIGIDAVLCLLQIKEHEERLCSIIGLLYDMDKIGECGAGSITLEMMRQTECNNGPEYSTCSRLVAHLGLFQFMFKRS
jgi:hypothetical protein